MQSYRKRAKNRIEWAHKCSACRQRDKPPSQQTIKELAKRVKKGTMSDLELRLITEQRRAKKEIKEGYACRQRWERTWLAELNAVMRPIKEGSSSLMGRITAFSSANHVRSHLWRQA